LPGYFLVPVSGPCRDLGNHGLTFAHLAAQPPLPIPVVLNCANAAPLFLWFYAGYLLVGAGVMFMVRAAVSALGIAVAACVALLCAFVVPFVPNADPYSYALPAFVTFVAHQSPYAVQHLSGSSEVASKLSALFPEQNNPLRIANYGPVSIGSLAAVVGPFGMVSLKAMILAERAFGAILLVVLGLLLSLAQADSQSKLRAFAVTVLNPLMLFYAVSFAHGDVLMLVLLAAAFLAYRNERMSLCAALCVLAFATRSVALVTIVVLFWELLYRRRYSALTAAFASAAVTALLVWVGGWYFLGGAGHADGFFYTPADAPGTVLATMLFGDTPMGLGVGLIVGAGIGLAIAYASLRERAYNAMPIAVLAALPGVEPWYAQWLAPVLTLTRNVPYRAALVAFIALAPLPMFVEMTSEFNYAAVHGILVVIQWGVPLAVYAAVRRGAALETREAEYAVQ
jgi:hypothetical protein